MDRKATWSLFLTVLASTSLKVGGVVNQDIIIIEKGSSSRVLCDNTENRKIVRAYWYKSDIFSSPPILKLEGGEVSGTEISKGHYDIDTNGAMMIRNATLKQEGLYSCIVFFTEEFFEGRNITVNISITKHTSGPNITVQSSCKGESGAGDCFYEGNITCSLNGIRPRMKIKWTNESIVNMQATYYMPSESYDSSSGTWNNSIVLTYCISSPRNETVFYCIVEDDKALLKSNSSSLRIKTDISCRDLSRTTWLSEGTVVTVVIVILFGLQLKVA